jgi:hypothetical protein
MSVIVSLLIMMRRQMCILLPSINMGGAVERHKSAGCRDWPMKPHAPPAS